MKEYSLDEIKNIVRPRLGDDIPLVLYRSLRIIGLRQILGEASGATLYMMGIFLSILVILHRSSDRQILFCSLP